MATVTYNFIPGEDVWVLTERENVSGGECPLAIEKGEVVTVDILIVVTGETITYNVRFLGESGTRPVTDPTDIYADADLASALTEYQNRLLLL